MWEGSGFQCVLRPPVVHPTALAWVPDREVLVVATRGGELLAVDLVLGVRAIADGLDETAALALHPDRERVLTLSRSRTWRVGTLGGDELVSGTHPFMRKMTGFFAGEHVVMLGDTASGHRVLHIFRVEGEGAERVTAMRLPKGVSATLGEHGELLLVRSTRAGLEVLSLRAIRRGARFRTGPETKHHLRGSGAWVLGFIPEGFCVWSREGGTPRSMRLADLTAGDVSRDGAVLGLGTRNGAIVLARTESIENRVRPDMVRAFDTPVTSAAFADRGRWLATGAEGLRIWSWADRPMS